MLIMLLIYGGKLAGVSFDDVKIRNAISASKCALFIVSALGNKKSASQCLFIIFISIINYIRLFYMLLK